MRPLSTSSIPVSGSIYIYMYIYIYIFIYVTNTNKCIEFLDPHTGKVFVLISSVGVHHLDAGV